MSSRTTCPTLSGYDRPAGIIAGTIMTVLGAAASGSFGVRPATPVDLSTVREMLEGADLPTEGVEQHLHNVLVGEVDGAIVAAAGLEVAGTAGLVRSVVVRSDHRTGGRGGEIVRTLLNRADAQGLTELFLLTTTATTFFRRLGFREVPRESAPLAIQQTQEFLTLCPSSAVCMRRGV